MSRVICEITRPSRSHPAHAAAFGASHRMANRGETTPESQKRELEPETRDQCVRQWDYAAGCWVAEPELNQVPDLTRIPGPAPKPVSDGSGRFWDILDRATGARIWRIEAGSWGRALVEKRALCAQAGGKSGFAYLQEVQD